MSDNSSELAARQGLKNNLFDRLKNWMSRRELRQNKSSMLSPKSF